MFYLFGLLNAQGFNQLDSSLIVCEAVYAQSSIPFASSQSSVDIQIEPYTSSGAVALAVFRYEDRFHIESNPYFTDYQLCVKSSVANGKCNSSELNKLILSDPNNTISPILNTAAVWGSALAKRANVSDTTTNNSTTNSTTNNTATTTTALTAVVTSVPAVKVPVPNDMEFVYNVTSDGLYCVISVVNDQDFREAEYAISMRVRNPYGSLPAIFYPAIPFHYAILGGYLIFFLMWSYRSYVNRAELLRIQNLFGGMILFLIIENIANIVFFEDFNNHGYISRYLLGVKVTFNAARNSISFFMILLISLGYGIVWPTLGKTMYVCVGLLVLHFIFGALYFTNAMLTQDSNASLVFLLGLPLAVTLMTFYVWILASISKTVKYLESKRQSVKLGMYNKLFNILTISISMLVVIFVANSINMMFRREDNWIANQWKWRWLLLDGSLGANYFITFVMIGLMWMPTKNNARLGLTQLDSEDMEEGDNEIELDFQKHHEDDDQVLEWAENNVNDDQNTLK
ncbi:hypothetical protein HK103_001648 [Boothiomyces macroporosus]|uniref:GOST seven transmembrane domain-containing protein n=1 Tax=Boothiomyces macroporosus TaxID=261099 RepID=A0AAD5UAA1_9FUNG|nr:hypothetical protein HK103_001648 [Boothiomyces macroporosus]